MKWLLIDNNAKSVFINSDIGGSGSIMGNYRNKLCSTVSYFYTDI